MADAELIRHQRGWHEFTTFIKISIAGLVVLLSVMALTLL
jgi:hypothetical protein